MAVDDEVSPMIIFVLLLLMVSIVEIVPFHHHHHLSPLRSQQLVRVRGVLSLSLRLTLSVLVSWNIDAALAEWFGVTRNLIPVSAREEEWWR